jgi:hypothetical protein
MALPPAARWAALATAALLLVLVLTAVVDDDQFPEAVQQAIDEVEDKGAETPSDRDLRPYDDLGTWVDAYDYGPAYQTEGNSPPVTPDDVEAMHEAGVHTIYLQVSREDERSPDGLVDADLVGDFLTEAHDRGMAVVGWYLPTFASVRTDLGHLQDLLEFEHEGHRLDGVGVDIEFTEAVPNPAVRSHRLVRLSEELDDLAGDTPLGAIVLPPVQTEVINPDLWPEFPWDDIAPHYDVWLPMSYWTFRTAASGYLDGATYQGESVRRLEANVGRDDLVIHGIGGIADEVTGEQLVAFVRQLVDEGAVGGSVYDCARLDESNRQLLTRLFETYPDIPA